ncbi:hypothetical protein [Actinosynnema sp. NPDC023587]|uniref:hypothetical protein n=1 Tax=Actinosynnema sp. NPDC023587 TaxID=3154695 RepID=UPI00340B0111
MAGAVRGVLPVRRSPPTRGQRHYVGHWWLATTGTLVGHGLWLERNRLILSGFDSQVVDIASQPFWLFSTTAEGKRRTG